MLPGKTLPLAGKPSLPIALSLRHKLTLVVLATTLAALLVTGAAMMFYDLRSYQQSWVNDLTAQADILGRASAAALAFDDPKTAGENLSLLRVRPQIAAAAIYTARGALFAKYAQSGAAQPAMPNLPESEGAHIEGKDLVVFRRIVDNKEILGTVYLRARYDLFERLKDYLAILSAVMVLSLLVAVLLSYWMHSVVIKPIAAISEVTRRVMDTRDFSLRAYKTTEDEIGNLVDGFNGMLAEIGRRAEALERSNVTLENEVAERRGAEEALRASERRNRTLVIASTSVVWTADGKGLFTEDQPSWSAYTGQSGAAYRGLGWREAFEAADRKELDVAWGRAMSAPRMFELELRLWHAVSARHRYVSVRAVPIVAQHGDVREWIGTVTDRDDQRRAEDELRSLNTGLEQRVAARTAEYEAANQDLESFSYSVSHDLRAPVRAISGYAMMLSEDHGDQFDDEAKRKVAVIAGEAERMGMLIDDLLAFSRLGRQSLRPTHLDMRAMAETMFDRLRLHHQGTQPEFRCGPLPPVDADRMLLEQVWINLLSNALKFSSGRERPHIETGAITVDTEHIYFVRDNGAGFDPRYQDKLFGVFQRLHAASEFPGTGVGLALVARIVNRHGGRVWAEGKPDAGATFYFTLPRQKPDGDSADTGNLS